MLLKYSFINLPNTLSTPQVASAKIMENTATITIKLEDSSLDGRVTLFLSSPIDSFIYVNMPFVIYFLMKGPTPIFNRTGGEARTPDTWFWRPVLYQLSYTRICCPTPLLLPIAIKTGRNELHPFIFTLKGIPL